MTNLLTREITISEIVEFLKKHFRNNEYVDFNLDFSSLENCELVEFDAELNEPNIVLEEINCNLQDMNFISLAA